MFVIFGIWLGLIAAMLALLLAWRSRLSRGNMDANVRAQFLRRYTRLATAIKVYPWLLMALIVVLGIIGLLLKR